MRLLAGLAVLVAVAVSVLADGGPSRSRPDQPSSGERRP